MLRDSIAAFERQYKNEVEIPQCASEKTISLLVEMPSFDVDHDRCG